MTNAITSLLTFCSRVDFGPVNLTGDQERFRDQMNRGMLSLCENLPTSMRTKATLFLMRYLDAPLGRGANFVSYFYPPSWSILFWLLRTGRDKEKLDQRLIQDVQIGHTMAMFLHAFDDHLIDGQLPVTHLSLLMRSESWMIMNQAYEKIARRVPNGQSTVDAFIDDYYSAIEAPDETQSLDCYCDLFRKQMATWFIAPVLLAKITGDPEYADAVQAAYASFGIAWRLVDDIQDLEKDMINGVHSSIYVYLDEDLRCLWDTTPVAQEGLKNASVNTILNYVREKKVVDIIKQRACDELEFSVSRAIQLQMPEWADEFRCMLKPLKQ